MAAAAYWPKDQVSRGHLTVISAKAQTSGHGSRDNKWASPSGNCYANFLFVFERPEEAAFLQPMAALTVGQVFDSYTRPLTLADSKMKWPNDLFIDNKKVCGVLASTWKASDDTTIGGLGIGVNLNEAPLDLSTSLKAYLGVDEINLEDFISRLAT
mmetsp:Transcript_26590/g.40587  ORF Transcript_26590/g.40587 Transcript_26590/m.40587 type:complete len:156 (-) Transcript_26590:267-734(-)